MTTTPSSITLHKPSVSVRPSLVNALSTSDRKSVATLLRQFDALALGEGDLTAGANTLTAMALSLANTAPPRSCVFDEKDGVQINVGMGMMVSGALSCGLVEERVLTVLQTRQNNLYDHVSQEIEERKAKLVSGCKFSPERDRSLPSTLEQLEHSDFMPFSVDKLLLRKLLQPSGSKGTREIMEFPVMFATVSSSKGLEAALNFAHQGRPQVHVTLSDTADLTLLAQVCGEVMGGCSKLSPLMRTANGHVIATDPLGILDGLMREGDKKHGWFDRLLWIGEYNAGPAFELGDDNDETQRYQRVGDRFEEAFDTVAVSRLDFDKQEPMRLPCEFAARQREWNVFLRGLEPCFPGITGTLRPLLASLCFGLWQMVIADGKGSRPFDLDGVMAFARLLALRMANAREMLHYEGDLIRHTELSSAIRLKLEDGPLTVRELTRKSHRLDAPTCHEALKRLVDSGLVVRNGSHWNLVPSKNPRSLTLKV